MEHLRWILLAAGIVLIAGVYLWGQRARRRSATPASERVARVEPADAFHTATRGTRLDPQFGPSRQETEPEAALPVIEVGLEDRHSPDSVIARQEPRFGIDDSATADAAGPAPFVAHEREPARDDSSDAPPARAVPEHKVIALRIVSAAAAPFPGRALRNAIESQGLAYGRYRIFHRLHEDGRALFSLASLKEPGTFELASMDDATFRGVAMFVVLPAPIEGARALDELVAAANAIAGQVGGLVQDERGIALGATRAAQLRAEASTYRPAATGT